MSWLLVIELEWPEQGTDFQGLISEVVDPLHRENIIVHGLLLEQVLDP